MRVVIETSVDVEAPRLAIAARKAQLRERDPHLGRPALVVHHDLRVPDAVPRLVLGRVVVERRIVVDHADLGPLGRRLPFLRVGLGEAGRGGGLAPRGLVEAAVEHDRRSTAHGADGGHRLRRGRRGRRLRPGNRGEEQQEAQHSASSTKTARRRAMNHPF